MTKYEIARWLTPGLIPMRLVFTTFGGSAHGKVSIEAQTITEDTDDPNFGEWSEVEGIGNANGIPEAKGEQIGTEHVNQFTGERVS